MGGIVAMAGAALARHRVMRLALLDTNHRADMPERYAIRNRQIAAARAGRLRQVIVDEMKPSYLARANRSNREILDLLIDMAMGLGPDVFVEQSLALRDRADQTHSLQSYEGPALVLCGAEDALCPPRRHAEIANLLKGATLFTIRDAGHITTLEKPRQVNEALERWLHTKIACTG
jgi:pimeloyl-ACP methyl ester carboxylesterase